MSAPVLEPSAEEIAAIAARGFSNPRFFCRWFLPEWFPKPMAWVHVGILALLTRQTKFLLEFDEEYTERDLSKILRHFVYKINPTDENSDTKPIFEMVEGEIFIVDSKFTLIMMPRGSSKTTLFNASNIYETVYQVHPYFLYLSEASGHACTQVTNVGRQLVNNPRLRLIFGNLQPDQRNEQGYRWSETEGLIQTSTGITFEAIGRGGQVRGKNRNGLRPSKIGFDDVEDKESVKTEDQRRKAREWLFGDVLPALPELNPDATIVGMGTLLSNEALLAVLEKDPEWTVIKFGVIDPDGEALWPAWMDLKKIEARKQRYALKGLLHIFYLEYFNEFRSPETQVFKPEFIHIAPRPLKDYIWRAMAMDPAISDNRRADDAVISGVGMTEDGIIGVLECWGKLGAAPRELIDQYFRVHFLLMPQHHGIEAQAYQRALIHLIREEMFRKGKEQRALGRNPSDAYFEITPITHSSSEAKIQRVEGVLQPRYASGYIVHQRNFPKLQTQLLDWPSGKKDYPDATAMAISLLDGYAAVAGGDTVSEALPPLDEVFNGDWRSH